MTTHTGWALAGALGAAASFGVANVVQMRAARRTPTSGGIDPGLLARLVRDRVWLAGLAASVLGYALQAVALFLAPVVLVQPLIVTELLFALPLAAMLAGARLGRREWTGAAMVAAGLAAFMLVAHPGGERTRVPAASWIAMLAGVAAAVAVLVTVAESHRRRSMLRASALAAAASVCFGLMSVLTKVVGHQFQDDRLAALLRPQPWLLAVVALVGLLLAQTAFRIAPLSVSLPLIDVGEPVVGSLLAVLVFGERLGGGAGVLAGLAAAAALVAAGVALLDSSPLVRSAQRRIETSGGPVSAGADGAEQRLHVAGFQHGGVGPELPGELEVRR